MSKNTNISELINYLSYDGSGNIVFSTVSAAASNTDKFLVSDAGTLKFRTAAQLLSDIGSQPALSGTGFVKISGTTISYDNSTYATQTYVGTAISNLVDSSPATLDTLNELAAALGDDPNFATTVATSIGTKQPQLNGTGFVKVTGTTVSYDNATYLTTGTAGTTYVPYTGATANVNLGVYNLAGGNVNINGGGSGGGALRLKQFGSSEANLEGYNSISTLTSGVFYFTSSASVPNFKNFALNPSGLTDNTLRTYTLPDASGTLALTSNIPSVSGVYLPLAGGTLTGPLTLSTNDQSSSRFKIINTSSTVPLGFSLIAGKAGITHEGFSIYNNTATRTDLYITETGEVSVYNFFNVTKADQAVMYLNNSTRAGGLGRDWGILNGNLGAGIFSIKDETAAANRFSIATDGVVTSNVSALIGIATDASAYMRISENQIWRTGGGALYINNSGTGSVIIASGGGAITLGTDTQVGTNVITTKNAGITGSNTYFGTGQVRIGGGSDHTTNVVLSVAPGVVNFDRPGVGGGALKIHSDGKIGINATTNNGYQLEVQTNATTAGLWVQTGGTTSSYWIADFRSGTNASALQIRADLQSTFGGIVQINPGTTSSFALGVTVDSTFAFGSTNGKRTVVFAHPSTADTGLQFGFDAVDKTGIIAGHATTNGSGLDFYAYDGSNWANRMRMTKNGVLGIGVNPSSSDWGTRSAIMLGGYGTALSSYNGGGGATELLHNAVVTSGFSYKYGITAASTKQYMDGNNIVWFRAPIGTAGAAITYTQLANLNSTGLAIGGTGDPSLRLSVYSNGSTITSGNVTFASQAKGIEIYNDSGSGTTDNLVGCWFSTGPHKAGIASGRTNAASNWAVDLRFFVHGPEIASLDNTYEKMRLYSEGNLTINGSLTQSGSLSDITLKENLVKIVTPLQKISQISGYTFTWKENAPARQHISNIVEDAGLIAQEVELILPEIVRTNEDGSKALNYNGVVGLLVEAMKELKAENDLLRQDVNMLKNK
jgi:hypothetical protein